MSITKRSFGTLSTGEEATLFEMTNHNGMKVAVSDFGAVIANIIVPDRDGNMADVALGFNSVTGYEENKPFFGSLIGRHANRIGGAMFTLNGITYELEKNEIDPEEPENDTENNLHSGFKSYNKYMYQAECFEDEESSSIELSRVSPDMEQGFPGNLSMSVSYTLTDANELIIEYSAVSDKDTIVNLTNHSYFNLAGHGAGSIEDHEVMIRSSKITTTDAELIPTGEYTDVEGTPMDFRTLKRIGKDIDADYEPLKQGKGYDHNYVLDKESVDVELCAKLVEPKSGRVMEVFTDLPGMQFYTGNNIKPCEDSKDGVVYHKRDGVCFETQFYPNSCNIKEFPSPVLRAGEEYNYVTIYKFSTME